MELRKITRWTSWSEWRAVMDDAYNEEKSSALYRRALARILAWESRDPMNMPPALIGLKELLIARLCRLEHHHKSSSSSSSHQIYFYQNNLALSLVRFVNFLTEPYQAKTFAKPIKFIASQIGLPDWIVNLRHSATHFSLPSVELLESAHEFLYEWIREKYVNVYKEIGIEKSIQDTVRHHMAELIEQYLVLRYKRVSTMKQSKKKNGHDETESEELLDQLIELSTQFKSEFWDVLLDDGALIPSREQMNAIGMVSDEFVDDEQVKLPKQLVNIWTSVLTRLGQSHQLGTLFDKLVESYMNETEQTSSFDDTTLRVKSLLCWIVELVRVNSNRSININSSSRFECDLRQVVRKIMSRPPTRYTISFLHELYKTNEMRLDKTQYDKLIKLVSLMLEPNIDTLTSSEIEAMDTLEETNFNLSLFETKSMENGFKKATLDNYLSQTRQNQQQQRAQIDSNWRLMDEIDWEHENLKLGQVEGSAPLSHAAHLDLNADHQFESSSDDLNDDSNSDDTSSSMMNGATTNSNLLLANTSSTNLFGSTRIDFVTINLDAIKSSLANNYWEFETRQ